MMQRWADYLDGLRSAELKIKWMAEIFVFLSN
jgi:hypothetical protein